MLIILARKRKYICPSSNDWQDKEPKAQAVPTAYQVETDENEWLEPVGLVILVITSFQVK